MKSIAKLLLAGAVVIATLALAAAPSEAAKKRAAAKCDPLMDCSVCKGKSCEVKRCDLDGKLYSNLIVQVCLQPNCPKKC